MSNVWILLANKSYAEILFVRKNYNSVKTFKSFYCDTARLQTKKLRNDKQGILFKNFSNHRSYPQELHKENEDLQVAFSKKIADYLDSQIKSDSFQHLFIFASPKMLGCLRATISESVHSSIVKSFSKNPSGLSDDEILTSLRSTSNPISIFSA